MTKSERIKGDPNDPVVKRKQKLIDRIRMQPHIKLLIIDHVNFYLSLFEDHDRKALISDLSEQQRVLDAKTEAEGAGKE